MTTDARNQSWNGVTDHAWRYFELHATQRMTLFNYFTFLAGLMSAGIASTLQSIGWFAYLGVVLGALLAVLSFVFWKLDQRVSFLIKNAELVLAEAEQLALPAQAQLFTNEPAATNAATTSKTLPMRIWTFGSSFRLVFIFTGLIGLSSGTLAALKAAEVIVVDYPSMMEKDLPHGVDASSK